MSTPTYTDKQLQLALAKMLPKKLKASELTERVFFWCNRNSIPTHEVKETEWLHICWLIEQNIIKDSGDVYSWDNYIALLQQHTFYSSASWQQRAVALAQVKGVEIV